MESRTHAAISLVVAAGAFVLTDPPVSAPVVVATALGVGVGVDVDHFLLSRYKTGDWRALARCLRNPTIVFVAQDEIFEPGTVGAANRLLTHLLVGGVAVPALWVVSPYVSGLVAVTLYAHVLADVVAMVRSSVVFNADRVTPAEVATIRAREAGESDSVDANPDDS